jgi:molybdate transport system ATP-binding protein
MTGGTLTASIRKPLSPAFALDVDLDAPPGVTIVFGASGSGKSTLLRCLAGLLTPDSGHIAIAGTVWFDRTAARNLPTRERRVGYVFQQLALFPHMTVAANLAFGVSHLPDSERRERINAIADRFRIAHLLSRKPGAISGGERQRTALARALVTDPALLLLDEPLSALDHLTQSRIMEDLRAWNAAHAIPILYVTHAHREVFALGERVVVLEHGRVLAFGTPQEVMDTPAHEALAQLAGFENFFTATVLSRTPSSGTMHCRIDQTRAELEVPLSAVGVGASIRIAIRAGDILLANQEPRGLSARNILQGTLSSMTREGTTVIARIDAGGHFVVHLTPSAVESLHLREGDSVWIVVKTHSCRLVSL